MKKYQFCGAKTALVEKITQKNSPHELTVTILNHQKICYQHKRISNYRSGKGIAIPKPERLSQAFYRRAVLAFVFYGTSFV